jgi:hypothetical protein
MEVLVSELISSTPRGRGGGAPLDCNPRKKVPAYLRLPCPWLAARDRAYVTAAEPALLTPLGIIGIKRPLAVAYG